MFFAPALGRQLPVDLCEFKASLVYIVSSKSPRLHRETLSQDSNNNKKENWGRFGYESRSRYRIARTSN